jgi:hypothetical protein
MSSVLTPIQTSRSIPSVDVHDAVLYRLEAVSTCLFDDLVEALGQYAWDEIFLAVDEMSRNGELILYYPGRSPLRVVLPAR